MTNFENISNDSLQKIILFLVVIYFMVYIYGAVFLLGRHIIKLIINKCSHKENKLISFINGRESIAFIFISMLILGVAGYVNAGIIKVKNYDVILDKKADQSVYNLVMITDTHIGNGASKTDIDTIVEKTNEIKPDYIFLTGDIIDENTSAENVNYIMKSFSKLESKYGTYAVMGNHEGYRKSDESEIFEKHGINVLEDEVVQSRGINIIGRKDYYNNPKDFNKLIIDNNVNLNKPCIVLSHEPLEYNILSDCGVDLVLSGHTHGVQFPGTYVFLKAANDMVYGLEKFGSMNAIVSSGAGEWGLHYTLPSSNEIVHIKLSTNALKEE